jgi:hypothetical protein
VEDLVRVTVTLSSTLLNFYTMVHEGVGARGGPWKLGAGLGTGGGGVANPHFPSKLQLTTYKGR